MPNENELASSSQSQNVKNAQEHTLTLLLQKIAGEDGASDLSESQVNEVLAQRRQVTDYIHKDRERESFDLKFYLVIILVFILIFSGGVLWRKPDAFSEVLSLLIGLFGGGFGGYGRYRYLLGA